MEEPNSKEIVTPDEKPIEKKSDKKAVGQLFGIQLSAPTGMKNPVRIFLLLVIGNFLLLFLVGRALGLF